MPANEYLNYELQPRHLTAAETSNPYLLIQELFSFGHLPQLREQLISWFKTTVTSSFNKKLNNSERGDIITMYEWMEKLLEAAHIIHVNRGGWAKSATGIGQGLDTGFSAAANLIALIKLTVQPESIFRLPAAGSSAPVFLLIVLGNKATLPLKQAELLTELACINNHHYSCAVINSAELQQKLSDGHIFYSSLCTYDNRLYEQQAPALPMLPKAKAATIAIAARNMLTVAYSRAAAFSVGAGQFIQKNQFAMGAFMLQQATEQLLRVAIMISMQQEIKTHAISHLLKYTRYCLPRLNAVFALPENGELVTLLDKAYIEAGYGNLPVSSSQANALQLLVAALFHETEESVTALIDAFVEVYG